MAKKKTTPKKAAKKSKPKKKAAAKTSSKKPKTPVTITNTSIYGIAAPILAWFAGTGLRASFNSENNNQKKGSIFVGVILLAVSYVWINSTSYWYVANEIEISGKNLLVISFFVGFLSTAKTISEINKS